MDILIAISDANRTMEVDSRLIEQPLVESATIFIDTDGLSISDPQVVEVLEVNNAMNETAPSSVLTHSTGISGDAGLRESLVGSSLTNSNSNSTSISSLTVSPPSLLHVDDFPTSYGPTRHGKHDTENKKGKTSPHKKPAGEMSLDKKLSFRTDSTGSMGSLVSGLDLSVSTIVEEHSDEDEESVESPVKSKFNQNNISSASILVSALKQKKQMRKKSVSFSIPSADDISRRAKKTSKLPLMYSTNDFDDNLADYQIISPKASSNERTIKPRTFSSPTRSGKYSNAIEITQLGDTVGIATHSPTASGREFFSTSPDLPPRPGHSRDSSPSGSPAAAAAATGGTQQEEHTAASRQHIHLRSLAIANQYSQSQQKGKGAGGQHPQNGVYGSVESPTAPPPPPPPPSLMQRICEARNPQELCQVFGISSESVFTGELMRKKFSKDLTAKGRIVWIVPKTKSIHWAKDSKEQAANVKVKYFLLDKNSPHLHSSTVDTTTTSTSTGAAAILVADTPAENSSTAERKEGGTGETGVLVGVGLTIDAAAAAAAETTAEGGAQSIGVNGAAKDSSSDTTAATANANGANGESTAGNSFTVRRAQGELLGVIHSAVINHLTIKIHTESGEYLSLTVNSGANAVERAKDWFSVIKTLTKDVQ